MTEMEIEVVMNALAGEPIVTTAAFADKVEAILRQHLQEHLEETENAFEYKE